MLIALKIMLAPLLVVLSTLAARRWGPGVGGWLLGLPLTSGPVSVLLFLEHGVGFTRHAAAGTLVGLVAAGSFAACYAIVAPTRSWWRALVMATAACLATAGVLSWAHPDLPSRMAIALVALAAFGFLVGAPRDAVSRPEPSPSTTALRMAIAGLVVFLVTTGAAVLGSSVAGMLASLPVVSGVMAVSLHRGGGRDLAGNLLRGALVGTWGGAAFFAVVGWLIAPGHVLETYLLATAAAVACAALATRVPAAARKVRRVAALAYQAIC